MTDINSFKFFEEDLFIKLIIGIIIILVILIYLYLKYSEK